VSDLDLSGLRSDIAVVGEEIADLCQAVEAIAKTQTESFELSRENLRAEMAATILAGMFSSHKEPSLLLPRLVQTAVAATDLLLDELDKPRQA
jgi:hypothetical protein